MGRARGKSKSQAVLSLRSKQLADESTMDRFEAVFGTTRGSGRLQSRAEEEAEARDMLLRRVVEDGDVRYYDRENKLHRDDGPAIEKADGWREWWQHGKLHRDGGPAVTSTDRMKMWCQHGKIHREDGPAVESPDGTREWYLKNNRHRDDGPAIERPDGTRAWYKKNKHHRLDGPAIEHPDGTCEWWQEGRRVTP